MIIDKIENANLYANLSERIDKAFEVLKDTDFSGKEDGRYDIDGDNLFYLVQRYETLPVKDGKLEAHKKYIDIQLVVAGKEMLGYAPEEGLEVETAYDDENDAGFYKVPADMTPVSLLAGMFCVLYPQDTHMPCRVLGGPENVLKVVFKVRIDNE